MNHHLHIKNSKFIAFSFIRLYKPPSTQRETNTFLEESKRGKKKIKKRETKQERKNEILITMTVHHDQQLAQKQEVIQQKPFEAPPEYSPDLPDFSVLRLDSPCQYGSSGNSNSHKCNFTVRTHVPKLSAIVVFGDEESKMPNR